MNTLRDISSREHAFQKTYCIKLFYTQYICLTKFIITLKTPVKLNFGTTCIFTPRAHNVISMQWHKLMTSCSTLLFITLSMFISWYLKLDYFSCQVSWRGVLNNSCSKIKTISHTNTCIDRFICFCIITRVLCWSNLN